MNFVRIFAASCDGGGFFGFPTWHKYLDKGDQCAPILTKLTDVWLIGLAIVEILLRIVILVTIIFVMYAGIKYSASRGNADKMASAKNTLTDALTGLVIAVVATAAVSFLAGQFTK